MKKPKLFTRIKKHPKWSMFIILLLFAAYYPWFYMGDSIEGVVLDKESGEPVVGAVAVLQFTVSKSKLHGSIEKVIHLAESVTDEEGRYTFDRWGPKQHHRTGRRHCFGQYRLRGRPCQRSSSSVVSCVGWRQNPRMEGGPKPWEPPLRYQKAKRAYRS